MSDESISPEDPWITEDGLVTDAFPITIDVETGKEKDIEKMADPRQEGDVPDPPPSSVTKSKKLTFVNIMTRFPIFLRIISFIRTFYQVDKSHQDTRNLKSPAIPPY